MLHMANGLYLSSPFYLDNWDVVGKSPLVNLFSNSSAVLVYGVLLFLNGVSLLYVTAGKSTSRYYTRITNHALLGGFLLRLFSLIGVFLTLETWRPPTYLSHVTTVLLLGAYWVWVKVSVRTIQ